MKVEVISNKTVQQSYRFPLIKKAVLILLINCIIIRAPLHSKLVEVEVRHGDTLHGFASKYLKDPSQWPEIYEKNKKNIKDPDKIYPGQVLIIPLEMLKDKVGDLTSLEKTVKVKKREKVDWEKGVYGERLFPEDGIMTGKKSFARVDFLVGSNLKVYEDSLIYLKPTVKKTAVASLLEGGLNVRKAKIITPSAEVVPKGESVYDIGIDKKKTTRVSVRDGEVDVKAQGKTVTVMKGYRTVVEFKKIPELPVALPLPGENALELKGDITSEMDLSFHLQVAETEVFEKIVKDEKTSDLSSKYIKNGLKSGKYFWRAAIIDQAGFKGDYSKPRSIDVRALSDSIVELTGFEIVNKEDGIMTITGFVKDARRVVINGYPAVITENGEFKTTIVLSRNQKTITVTAIGSSGVILRKYHRSDDGMWFPAK